MIYKLVDPKIMEIISQSLTITPNGHNFEKKKEFKHFGSLQENV